MTRVHDAGKWIGIAIGAFCAAGLATWATRYGLQSLAFHADYGAQAPAAVFQEAMGQPTPAGVTDLQVSGRKYYTRTWVWMRFRATDGALKQLVTDGDKYRTGNVAMVLRGTMWVGNPRYDAADLRAVGWEDVSRIRTPIIYRINRPPTDPASVWVGNIILDPDNHLVYVEMMCG